MVHLHDLEGDRVVGVVDEVEDIGVAEDLLEQADLPLRVFPLAVEHVDGEGAAEALHLWNPIINQLVGSMPHCLHTRVVQVTTTDLKSPLEGADEEDESLSVLDGEAGVVEVVDDLLPMERRLQLVHNLDEQLHVPRLRLGGLRGGKNYNYIEYK